MKQHFCRAFISKMFRVLLHVIDKLIWGCRVTFESKYEQSYWSQHVSHTACTPNCHGTVAHMHSHWLTLPHLSTHKASYECSNILLPTCFSQFHTAPHTRTHTHTCVTTDSDVTFPFSKNTCSSVTTWGAEQADKSALHSNCLNRALHCCSFLWW